MSVTINAAELIAAERDRHEDGGFTPEHDDRYTRDELVRAAICYAYPPYARQEVPVKPDLGTGWVACSTREALYYIPELWPFNPEAWRPSPSRLKELVKAGALIAAEIDRILRAEGQIVG